jgi:membrane protein YqaA with SNARE-associated domain
VKRLGVVAIVFAGLLVIGQSISLLSTAMRGSAGSGLRGGALLLATSGSIAGVGVGVVFGVLLIAFRRQLADRWFDDDETGWSIDGVTLLRVGLVLLGTIMVAEAIPTLFISMGSAMIQAFTFSKEMGSDQSQIWSGLLLSGGLSAVFGLVRALIGVLLVVYAGRLSGRLMRQPRVATPRRSEPVQMLACASCGATYDPADYREGA